MAAAAVCPALISEAAAATQVQLLVVRLIRGLPVAAVLVGWWQALVLLSGLALPGLFWAELKGLRQLQEHLMLPWLLHR